MYCYRNAAFYPRNNTFSAASGQMDAGRFFPTATLLKDGHVLIAGGYDADIRSTAGAWLFVMGV